MTDDDKRPFLSAYQDRHGKTRWRFRRDGKTKSIPGDPGEPEFEEAYSAAIEGRTPRKAAVVAHPGATVPKSFKACWRLVLRSPEWIAHDESTRRYNSRLAEEFMMMPVAEGHPATWGEMPIGDLRRRHLKEIIARLSDTPHKAKHTLVAIRKMIAVALDQEWIETDPSHKLSYRPAYTGWRAWTDAEREQFESRWPLGSTPRTCYGLALWLGNRRSDVARVKWSDIDFKRGTVTIEQTKGGKVLVLPLTPMLREILASAPRTGETVLVTQYGKPFSQKSLTGRMADWTASAGLPAGCTIHGLRKALGAMMAESGASTRQSMGMLGHDDIQHVELYSRAAEQERLARDAMARVTRLHNAKKPAG